MANPEPPRPRTCPPIFEHRGQTRARSLSPKSGRATTSPRGARTQKSKVVGQLRALQSTFSNNRDAWSERPQTGTGFIRSPPNQVATAVVKLARLCDRGVSPPLPLLLECLTLIQGLDLAAVGGDGLLWMVAPVLRAAFSRLQDAAAERRALESEVAASHLRFEQLNMDVEHEREWFRRAVAHEAQRVKDRREAARNLEVEADQLEIDLVKVEAESAELRQQADEGLAGEREKWGIECKRLEHKCKIYSKDLEDLASQDDLGPQSRELEESLDHARKKILENQPAVNKNMELAKRVDDREMMISDLRNEIDEKLAKDAEKKTKKKKGKKRG